MTVAENGANKNTQAVRQVFPIYRGEFVSMLELTSIVGCISIENLTKAGDIIRSRTYEAQAPEISECRGYYDFIVNRKIHFPAQTLGNGVFKTVPLVPTYFASSCSVNFDDSILSESFICSRHCNGWGVVNSLNHGKFKKRYKFRTAKNMFVDILAVFILTFILLCRTCRLQKACGRKDSSCCRREYIRRRYRFCEWQRNTG